MPDGYGKSETSLSCFLASKLILPAPQLISKDSPPMIARFFMNMMVCSCCSASGNRQKLWKIKVVGIKKANSANADRRVLQPNNNPRPAPSSTTIAIVFSTRMTRE